MRACMSLSHTQCCCSSGHAAADFSRASLLVALAAAALALLVLFSLAGVAALAAAGALRRALQGADGHAGKHKT